MYTIFEINSLDREKQIVKNEEAYKAFFEANNIVTNFPKTDIETEYDLQRYEAFKDKVAKEWGQVEGIFFAKLIKLFNLKIEQPYKICITNYGAMGFYNEPAKTVYINMNYLGDFRRLIAHELVHLMVEPFIREFKVDHQRKENLVNTLLELLKPN